MEKPQSYISLTPSQVLGNSLKGKLVVESRGDYSLIVDSFPLSRKVAFIKIVVYAN